MISSCAIEAFRRLVNKNETVYITAEQNNGKKKIYKKVLEIIGGANKVHESIYESGDDKDAAKCAPYISKCQIKKLGGSLFGRHELSINSHIILKHIIERIKYCENNIKYRNKDRLELYNFCKFLKDLENNIPVIDQLTPDIVLKFQQCKIDPNSRNSILQDNIGLNIKNIEQLASKVFNCQEREIQDE